MDVVPEARAFAVGWVEYDCASCGDVFTQRATEGAPLERMPDEMRELRARAFASVRRALDDERTRSG